jgi:predicted TIM-barrel fold metal-dependent hydrolase
MRIDIHSHFICLDFIKHLQGRDSLPVSSFEDGTYVTTCCPGFRIPAVPRFVDMEVKLRDMEEMKVDVSVLSHVQPGSEVLPSNEADYWASRINDHLAGIIEKYPRKFLGWGCLGFGSTERTIKEIDRCISELGFAGILLYSNINGKALDSPEFRPVYKHIARLGVPIFMHPTIPLNLVGMDKGSLISGLGFMYDTSLNTVRLIQSGLFDEEPGLKLIMPHVGGVLPYLKGRLERTNEPAFRSMSYQPPLQHPFGYYLLQQLYFDTVCYHIEALEYCYHMVGGERLLYGTDHPVGQPFDLVAGMLERLQCTDEERDLIYCGNAKRLLRVK